MSYYKSSSGYSISTNNICRITPLSKILFQWNSGKRLICLKMVISFHCEIQKKVSLQQDIYMFSFILCFSLYSVQWEHSTSRINKLWKAKKLGGRFIKAYMPMRCPTPMASKWELGTFTPLKISPYIVSILYSVSIGSPVTIHWGWKFSGKHPLNFKESWVLTSFRLLWEIPL